MIDGFLVRKADGVGDDVSQTSVSFVGLPLPVGTCSVAEDPVQGFRNVCRVPGRDQGVPYMVVERRNDVSCSVRPVGYGVQ